MTASATRFISGMLLRQTPNGVAHELGVVDQQYLVEPSMPDEK
jgi:hypothetical protein